MSQARQCTIITPDGNTMDVPLKGKLVYASDILKETGFADGDQYQYRMRSSGAASSEDPIGDVIPAEALSKLEIEPGDMVVVFPREIGG